jgi:lysophospholipase L1-like esterase
VEHPYSAWPIAKDLRGLESPVTDPNDLTAQKVVLCYGDSNTWGYDPATRNRFGPTTRWTGVLAQCLGPGFRVIEEGLNGRTTVFDDPLSPGRNGLTYLLPCLESHCPVDLVTIMLGTNDLKQRFNHSASDIAEGAGLLADFARRYARRSDGSPATILLMAPPPIVELTDLDLMFEGAYEKSRLFGRHYERVARWNNLPFLDAGKVVVSSQVDGIHFDADQHRKLGEAVAEKVRSLLEVE